MKKIVLIEWNDAVHEEHGWCSSLDIKHIDDRVWTVGFIIREDKQSITVVQSDGISAVANPCQIPKKMITKRKVLDFKEF